MSGIGNVEGMRIHTSAPAPAVACPPTLCLRLLSDTPPLAVMQEAITRMKETQLLVERFSQVRVGNRTCFETR